MATGTNGTLYAVWADERQDPVAYDMPEVLHRSRASARVGPGGSLVVWRDDRSGWGRLLQRIMP